MRPTMSFSSWRHSKYAISAEYPASTSVSYPARISAVTPPQRTACSPKRSVSVSSRKEGSITPARVDPMGGPCAEGRPAPPARGRPGAPGGRGPDAPAVPGGVLVDGNEGGYAFPLHVLRAHEVAGAFRGHHEHVHVGPGDDLPVMDIEPVGEHEVRPFLPVRAA